MQNLNTIADLKNIREKKPLVHNITNYVVMNSTANALLSLGASPVMAHSVNEVEDMVNIASALVINIGTLSEQWIIAMKKAMKAAALKSIPIVFDPVGAGATPYRTQTCFELLAATPPTIIRGNASEIISLAVSSSQSTKGVDSTDSSSAAIDKAIELAERFNCIVSISGEIDYIVGHNRIGSVANGNAMMPLVTGLGCTASAITGAFAAVNKSSFDAAVNAMILMGITGEIASEKSSGPGSLQLNFIDTLYSLQYSDIEKRTKFETIK